jgi:hypothetical protein
MKIHFETFVAPRLHVAGSAACVVFMGLNHEDVQAWRFGSKTFVPSYA